MQFGVLVLIAFLLNACSLKSCQSGDKPGSSEAAKPQSKVVAQVGQFAITAQMVEDRDKIIRLGYPHEKRSLGLAQLQKAFMDAQILINNGHRIDEQVLQQEKQRIDKNTKAPEKLQEIKNVFGERTQDYLHTYVLPTYARRVIYYDFFLNNSEVQKESYHKAQDFLKKARQDPSQWDELIEQMQLLSMPAKVSLYEGFQFIQEKEELSEPVEGVAESDKPQLIDQSANKVDQAKVQAEIEERQRLQQHAVGQKWIDELITPSQPGDVVNKVINQGETGWLVVRYIKPDPLEKHSYHLEAAIIPKRDFATWHAEESKKIKITLN